MKESVRAARDEVAHNKSMAALKALMGEGDAQVTELEGLRAQRLPAVVGSMMEREMMADILERAVRVQRVSRFAAALAQGQAEEAAQSPPDDGRQDDGEDSANEAPHNFSPIVGEKANEVLFRAGYRTPEQLRAATDEELLALDEVGKTTLKKIRDKVG